jgi:hypothetical protein
MTLSEDALMALALCLIVNVRCLCLYEPPEVAKAQDLGLPTITSRIFMETKPGSGEAQDNVYPLHKLSGTCHYNSRITKTVLQELY